jgi:hypothetical protein
MLNDISLKEHAPRLAVIAYAPSQAFPDSREKGPDFPFVMIVGSIMAGLIASMLLVVRFAAW